MAAAAYGGNGEAVVAMEGGGRCQLMARRYCSSGGVRHGWRLPPWSAACRCGRPGGIGFGFDWFALASPGVARVSSAVVWRKNIIYQRRNKYYYTYAIMYQKEPGEAELFCASTLSEHPSVRAPGWPISKSGNRAIESSKHVRFYLFFVQ